MQQAVGTGFRTLRSSLLSHCSHGVERNCFLARSSRVFSSQSAAACASLLDKQEVTNRVVDLLKSIPFIDPSKVHPLAKFKDDLQLDTLDSVEVIMAVEQEFAVDIPDSEAKFSSTAHLIDYIATHPHAK